MIDTTAAHKDKLLAELRLLAADAEELLRATAGDAGEHAAEWRDRLQVRLQQARERLAHLPDTVVTRARETGQATDAYVHDHPWKAAGVAGAIGLLTGLLIGRR